ncbi:reverse transcriptase domain-containing protein [Tanacetum coccineum]|uniref:Reverse transcriptase domain-containing protein n=1 Tax=Tanacetum coccineum TaxID=301880 RepID=A0ABQ5ATG4_9ASTR
MSSSSLRATVTYTSISSALDSPPWGFPLISESDHEAPEEAPQSPEQAPPAYVPAPEYLEYLAPSDDEVLAEDQPLPTDASPTTDSPGYIADSEPIEDDFKEDLEMDRVDYTDDDKEEEESSDDDEEEEYVALANSNLPIPNFVPSSEEMKSFQTDEARIYVRTHTPPSPSVEARLARFMAAPTLSSLPPSLLSPLLSPLPRIPSPPLLLPPLHTSPTYARAPLGYKATMVRLRAASPSIYHPLPPPLPLPLLDQIDDIPEADMPPWKRTCFTTPSHKFNIRESLAAAAARQTGPALTHVVDYGFIDTLDASIRATDDRVMTALEGVNKRMTDLAATHRQDSEEFYTHHQNAQDDRAELRAHITTLSQALEARIRTLEAQKMAPKKTTTPITDAAIKLLIAQGVADALAKYEANKSSGNGHDNHSSGSGSGRTPYTTRECTYSDFLKCQPINFKGTERVTVGHDAAYGMTWKTLMKMLTEKYYPRSEIKKLEIEIWNLKVKGTDVVSYTQRFQELALMCGRMFHEESDQVEKYVRGLPDMIQGSVMASKPKMMQEAIELANDLMDQKIRTFAERQAENERKLEDNTRNNQTQQ